MFSFITTITLILTHTLGTFLALDTNNLSGPATERQTILKLISPSKLLFYERKVMSNFSTLESYMVQIGAIPKGKRNDTLYNTGIHLRVRASDWRATNCYSTYLISIRRNVIRRWTMMKSRESPHLLIGQKSVPGPVVDPPMCIWKRNITFSVDNRQYANRNAYDQGTY